METLNGRKLNEYRIKEILLQHGLIDEKNQKILKLDRNNIKCKQALR